jgi:hypothetical protein
MPCRDLRFSVGCVYARMDMDHGVTVCRRRALPMACESRAACGVREGTVRASDDTFNKKQPNFPTYMRLDSTATLVHVS